MRVSFVGDVMCEQEQLVACSTNAGFNFNTILESVRPVFDESDFSVANLESPIAGPEFVFTNHKWLFNSPIEFAQSVKSAGFDLVSTANNHCLDRGVEGAFNTLKNLDAINLEQVGLNNVSRFKGNYVVRTIKGVKIAFLSYTYGTNANFNKQYLAKENRFLVDLYRAQEPTLKSRRKLKRYIYRLKMLTPFNIYMKRFRNTLQDAKAESDYVVVLMHSGGQYNLIPDKWTVKLTDDTLDWGADLVVGCHPHVVQKGFINESNKKAGFYSLGNFCSYPGSEASGDVGLNALAEYSVILHVHLNESEKKLERISFEIAKTIVDEEDKIARTFLLYDLIQRCNEKKVCEKLINDNFTIAKRFLGLTNDSDIALKKEYDFSS